MKAKDKLAGALSLVQNGISIIPIEPDGEKKPKKKDGVGPEDTRMSWKAYQVKIPTQGLIKRWFQNSLNYGVAIVCGKASGNLECLDFDSEDYYEKYIEKAYGTDLINVIDRLILQKSPNGYHLIYRCQDGISGNKKLASRFCKEENKPKGIIETRGLGGYFLSYLCPPECHITMRRYELVRGSFDSVPEVTAAERNSLHDFARLFNEHVEKKHVRTVKSNYKNRSVDGDRPGDEFNERGDFPALLEKHGWTQSNRGFQAEYSYWRRPGKTKSYSATLGYVAPGKMYVFSDNASPFENERVYDLFTAYVLLEHDGNYKTAVRELVKQGYGKTIDSKGRSDSEINVILNQILTKTEDNPHDGFSLIINRQNDYLEIINDLKSNDQDLFLVSLQRRGITQKRVDDIRKRMNGINSSNRQAMILNGDNSFLPKVIDSIEDAPVGETVVVPESWSVNDVGLFHDSREKLPGGGMKDQIKKVTPSPLFMTGILENVVTMVESCHLTWRRNRLWRSIIVERDMVSNLRKIVDISKWGFPVTSITAAHIIQYLSDFESENYHVIPKARISNQMGWQPSDNPNGFLVGRRWIGGGKDVRKTEVDIEKISPLDWPGDVVVFRGGGGDDGRIADSYNAKGTIGNWLDTVQKIKKYPRVLISVFASLAPTLLRLTGTPNFVMSWSGPTSTGKSITLKLAASIWGEPKENSKNPIYNKWDVTPVFLERYTAITNDLPSMFDDTKMVRNPNIISKVIFSVASGRGRGRGTKDAGVKDVSSTNTILLSTGEQRMTSFSKDGGAKVRVLEIWGIPFEKQNKAMRKLSDEIEADLLENYGYAGLIFVKYIVDNQSKWKSWRDETYRKHVKTYKDKAGDNPYAGRIASYLALLETTLDIFNECFELSGENKLESPISDLYDSLVSEASEADNSLNALKFIYDWSVSNQNRFSGRTGLDSYEELKDTPLKGWAGIWGTEEANWDAIYFIPTVLTDLLESEGYERDVIKVWHEKGWLKTDARGWSKVQKTLARQRIATYAIKKEALDRLLNENDGNGELPKDDFDLNNF